MHLVCPAIAQLAQLIIGTIFFRCRLSFREGYKFGWLRSPQAANPFSPRAIPGIADACCRARRRYVSSDLLANRTSITRNSSKPPSSGRGLPGINPSQTN